MAVERTAIQCFEAMQADQQHLKWASAQVDSSPDAFRLLRVGFSINPKYRRATAFPMLNEAGRITGIRYRDPVTGAKWSETGSRDGMFYGAGSLSDRLVIVEGATDAAALISLGFNSVIGRSNCSGNVEQLKQLCKRIGIVRCLLIPDTDSVGRKGAEKLANELHKSYVECSELIIPEGTKDVRRMKAKDPSWLRARVQEFFDKSS